MRIKLVNIKKEEDRVLLSQYLSKIGYGCSTREGSLSFLTEDVPKEIADEITHLTVEELHQKKEVLEIVAEGELRRLLVIEEEKLKLERVIANSSLPQSVRDVAQLKLEELEGSQ